MKPRSTFKTSTFMWSSIASPFSTHARFPFAFAGMKTRKITPVLQASKTLKQELLKVKLLNKIILSQCSSCTTILALTFECLHMVLSLLSCASKSVIHSFKLVLLFSFDKKSQRRTAKYLLLSSASSKPR